MSYPIRRFDLCVVREDNGKKFYDKVGRITEWPKDDGGTRLQTELFMFPDLNLATFEQKPREESGTDTRYAQNSGTDPIDVSNIPF